MWLDQLCEDDEELYNVVYFLAQRHSRRWVNQLAASIRASDYFGWSLDSEVAREHLRAVFQAELSKEEARKLGWHYHLAA